LVTRYSGSFIKVYSVAVFDEFNLPLGKLKDNGLFEKGQHLEGKITRIGYAAPAGRSILEVYRNYENALQRGGFTTLYSCANRDGCGSGSAKLATTENDDWGWSAGHRAISAELVRTEGDVYVSMHIGQWSDLASGSFIMLFVVEVKPMEGGLVTVDAGRSAATSHVVATPPSMGSTSTPPRRSSSPSPTPLSKRLRISSSRRPRSNSWS
jgi:hypothetical protein